uniref:PDZ domain-containing protein n=1 Tax=Octactis speculum TaxID=3111310 RepID=A0A7S2DIQ3_9STRA
MTKPDFKSLLSDKCISDNKIELIANEWNNPKKDSMEQVLSISPPKNNKTLGMKFIVMFANSEQQVMVIHTVSQKSLAEKAGVKPLHVLLKINGASTTQMTEQDAIVAFDDALKKKTGFTVTVGILPSSQTFQRAIGSNVEGLRFSPRTQRVRKSFVQEQEKINRQMNDGGS